MKAQTSKPTALDDPTYAVVSSIYRTKGFPTISKLVQATVKEYLENHPSKEDATLPKTDQERCIAIVNELGRMNEEYGTKFNAIRSFITPSMKAPEKESDIDLAMNEIWKQVCKANGHTMVGKKIVAISSDDVECFGRALRLRIEKERLEATLQK